MRHDQTPRRAKHWHTAEKEIPPLAPAPAETIPNDTIASPVGQIKI